MGVTTVIFRINCWGFWGFSVLPEKGWRQVKGWRQAKCWEIVEAESGEGKQRVEKGSRNKAKKEIKSMAVKREKGCRMKGGVVTGHGNAEQQAG